MKRLSALIGFLAILTSCTTVGERMSRISSGMTKPEVVNILGKPKSTGGGSGVEVLHYTHHSDWFGWFGWSYYFVRFVDGKVESYGPEASENPVSDSNPPLRK